MCMRKMWTVFQFFLLCYSEFKISSTFPGFLVLPQSRITFGISRKMNQTYSRNKLCLYIISCSQFHLYHHYNSFSLIFRVEFYVSHSYTLFLGDFGTRTLSRVVNRIFGTFQNGKVCFKEWCGYFCGEQHSFGRAFVYNHHKTF